MNTLDTSEGDYKNQQQNKMVDDCLPTIESTNHHENGVSHLLQENQFVNRKDLVRLIIQALDTLNYKQSAILLEKESGVDYLSKDIVNLKNSVLNGEWKQSIDIVNQVLNASNCKNINVVKYLILEEKYMELLGREQIGEALKTLREEITPIISNYSSDKASSTDHSILTIQNLQRLASYLLCPTNENLKTITKWKGKDGGSRKELMQCIQKWVSPSLIIPDNKLEQLLLTAINSQKSTLDEDDDMMDESDDGVSLLDDKFIKQTESLSIPNKLLTTLEDHGDEVWICKFSNNGELLASSSIDHSINIYKVSTLLEISEEEKPKPHFSLSTISNTVAMEFSPDDKEILTATTDGGVFIWNTGNGELKASSKILTNIVAAFWTESGNRFITITGDKVSQISIWERNALSILKSFKIDTRIQDGVLLGEDKILVATHDKQMFSYHLGHNKLLEKINEDSYITSVLASKNGRLVLVSFCSDEDDEPALIHLWDLKEKKIITKFEGFWSVKFVVKPIFIGTELVACGSEDHKICFWNKHNGDLLESMTGHSGVVNTLAYNKKYGILASASDDTTVKIWKN